MSSVYPLMCKQFLSNDLYPLRLETRSEGDFCLQRRVVAGTGLDARHVGVAVGQPCQVLVPLTRNPDAP